MPKRTKNYDASLMEALRDPKEAAAYLAASFNECHEALRHTERERDRERARADKAEADAKHVRHINSTLATELTEAGKEIEAQRARADKAEAALAFMGDGKGQIHECPTDAPGLTPCCARARPWTSYRAQVLQKA